MELARVLEIRIFCSFYSSLFMVGLFRGRFVLEVYGEGRGFEVVMRELYVFGNYGFICFYWGMNLRLVCREVEEIIRFLFLRVFWFR